MSLSTTVRMSDPKAEKAAKAAAKAADKALRLSNNVWSNKYFAISMGAIMVLFAIYHWSSVIHFHYDKSDAFFLVQRWG